MYVYMAMVDRDGAMCLPQSLSLLVVFNHGLSFVWNLFISYTDWPMSTRDLPVFAPKMGLWVYTTTMPRFSNIDWNKTKDLMSAQRTLY